MASGVVSAVVLVLGEVIVRGRGRGRRGGAGGGG